MISAAVSVVFASCLLVSVSAMGLFDILSPTNKFKRRGTPLRELPAGQVSFLRQAFSQIDPSGDGMASSTEMQTFLSSQGQTYSNDQMAMLWRHLDINGDGGIDFDEYLAMQGFRAPEGSQNGQNGQVNQPIDPKYQSFQVIDQDGSGFITSAELMAFTVTMGQTVSEGNIQQLIIMADKSGDGKVDFQEFKAMGTK